MMKHWIKIFFIGFTIFMLLLVCLHIIVHLKGKDFLTKKLEETFKRQASIGSLSTSFPINIYVKDIEVKGLFKIDEVFAGGGLLDIFRRSFSLSLLKLTRPVVTIERGLIQSTAEAFIPPPIQDAAQTTKNETVIPIMNPLALLQGRFLLPGFSLGRLIVNDGTLNLIDRSIKNNEILIKVEQVNIKADNLSFGIRGPRITSFELKGAIPWREGQEKGKIEAEGWLNFFKKNMEATLKIEDIDGVYLYPYYSKWVDLEKARIEKARLNFASSIHGLNNNVTAECHLELTDIVRKPRPPEEDAEKAEKITNFVLDIFRALNQGKIVLDFTIRTKMDRPEFGFGNIKMAFEDKLARARSNGSFKAEDVLRFPGKLLEGMVKGATDFSKAVIDGTFAVGNELKKAVEGSFKREPKEE